MNYLLRLKYKKINCEGKEEEVNKAFRIEVDGELTIKGVLSSIANPAVFQILKDLLNDFSYSIEQIPEGMTVKQLLNIKEDNEK